MFTIDYMCSVDKIIIKARYNLKIYMFVDRDKLRILIHFIFLFLRSKISRE